MGNAAMEPQVPRVLFLIDHLENPHAGTEGQLHLLVSGLMGRGIECHLLVLKKSAYLESGQFPCPWSVLGQTRLSALASWRAMHRFGKEMAQRGFRIAHTFFNDSSVLAPPTFALAGIKTVISRRDMGYWYDRRYRSLLRLTGRWVAACSVNSVAVRDVTIAAEHIPSDRIHVIYNGLPPVADLQPDLPILSDLRARGRILAGVVANIRPIKRIEDFLDALGALRYEVPMLDAVIIGGGDPNALSARAQALGVGDRVHFLGQRNDVSACLRQMDIGVLCSESEGFSNAVIEYMQAGLPTVCTRTGGNPAAITHGHTGFLYGVADVPALAEHLACLARDPALQSTLGRAAQADADQRFSVESMVSAHCALYRSVLSRSSGA